MEYKYGVSYNCIIRDDGVGYEEIGGGGDGYTSLDYVGNDLDKIEQYIVADRNYAYKSTRDHPFIGSECELGGEIVSVIVDGDYPLCVIFEDPTMARVIE